MLAIRVLGSGSGGNSTVVKTAGGTMLIDAGFGPQSTAKKMRGSGVEVGDIKAIVLTHLDRDHINLNWLATLVKYRIRVYCHQFVEEELRGMMREFAMWRETMLPAVDLVATYETGVSFEPLPGVQVKGIHLPHDKAGSHGFRVEVEAGEPGEKYTLGYATDLGRVPADLVELFCGVDVLAMESNYDPEMERNSERPWMLKQRVMGGQGHLSNEQAFTAVRQILDATERNWGAGRLPRHIVLLHRSRDCNCPELVRELFARDERIRERLILAEQQTPTHWLAARDGDAGIHPTEGQISLQWG